MHKKQELYAAVATLWLALSASNSFAAERYNLRGTWEFDFIGLQFAKLWVALDESQQDFKMTAGFKSTGIVGLFERIRSLSQSEGTRLPDGQLQATWFQYENEEDGKRTLLRYNAAGELTERDVVPEDDPWHRPPVKAEEVADAASPGDVIFTLREIVANTAKTEGASHSIRFYEGKRLANITFTYVASPTISLNGAPVSTHQFHLSRELINGYTDKEIRRHREGDPEVFLFFRQSDHFPVAMEARLPYGTMKARWVPDPQ